ncbi:hypothetical protein KSP40_PGU008909 [Platanthera guangdongensis]|uniref:Uncharacterized protein n=1 Tax=Platanthera guangdongensis TaxID=2320717 RepID=A0ABR2LIW5_9ASPA
MAFLHRRSRLEQGRPRFIIPALPSVRTLRSFSPGTAFSKNSQSHLLIKWDGRTLDVERAKLSLEHMRALNTEFVSWVQSQLQNHLDELWIDGVKYYLSHASNIWQGRRALGLKFG